MLNNTQAAEVVAATAEVTAKTKARPDAIAVERAAVVDAANKAASFASDEAGHRLHATVAHAHAAWHYMDQVTSLTDAEKHKAATKAFGDAFKAAYKAARNASDDAAKKALSRVKATATRAYNADCSTPDDIVALGTQTDADKRAADKRNGDKRGGAMPAALAQPQNIVRDAVGAHDVTYAALAAFLEIFDAGTFKAKNGGDMERIRNLRGQLVTQLRKHQAAVNAE